MVITRTPFRISFFGGGTDYPVWFREHGGAVLATTINKYCYITCRHLPPFFDHKSRIVWSHIELVQNHKDILHPAVRAAVSFLDIQNGMELHHHGDLPARSGLGTSSSFSVGVLHALHVLEGRMPAKMQLAREAIHLEQDLLGENVGCQDQVLAACGGFQKVEFFANGEICLTPVVVRAERACELQQHLMLFYTGQSRRGSEIAREQIEAVPRKTRELSAMRDLVDQALTVLCNGTDICRFGELLHESWRLKRSLSGQVSTAVADSLYEAARAAGAIGGKLLGAGGGGFMLLFARPEDHKRIKRAAEGFLYVPFRFESLGTQVIFYEQNGFNGSED